MRVPALQTAIVIVPGAWHTPEHFRTLVPFLENKGYRVRVERNPSCDSKTPLEQTVEADVAAIRNNLVLPLVDAGHDVVLLMHSYGGVPGAAAALGLSKAERVEQGRPGGIIGLAFISASLVQEGDVIKKTRFPDGKFRSWHKVSDDGQIMPEGPREIFYGDVPSPLVEQAIAALRPQSRTSFESASPPQAWSHAAYNGRRSFLQCTEDNAFSFEAQTMMLQSSGVDWDVAQMHCSHSPFLTYPKETASWVDQQARGFASIVS